MSDDQHTELKALWKHRWEEAKLQLELAAIHVKQIEQQMMQIDAYRQALETEILAAVEYTRVLRIYTDLVVYGKVPDETRVNRASGQGLS